MSPDQVLHVNFLAFPSLILPTQILEFLLSSTFSVQKEKHIRNLLGFVLESLRAVQKIPSLLCTVSFLLAKHFLTQRL